MAIRTKFDHKKITSPRDRSKTVLLPVASTLKKHRISPPPKRVDYANHVSKLLHQTPSLFE